MNVPIIDPLQGDFPEVIEEYLEHGVMRCVSFNRRGTLLAAGCSDGSCVIWDFETRGIAKELHDRDCVSPVTSVCWSKYGHRVLVSAADKSLMLWDVASGERIARQVLQQTPLLARLHPGVTFPSLCLTCPLSSPPVIVDMITGATTELPATVPHSSNGTISTCIPKSSDGLPSLAPTAACFNKNGDLVYIGNSKGEILVMDHTDAKVYALIPTTGSAMVKSIVFSRNGQYLLTNSNDRTIRIYENLLPPKGGLSALKDFEKVINEPESTERMKAIGSKCLALFREFQDSVTKIHWKAPCFSGDGEWVAGGSASKGEHKIYVWDRAGHLVKILEGPREALIDLSWHPLHPIVVSVSLAGLIYIWAKDYTENWSAFAPDFKELEENEEYVEREDEFDLMPESEKVKEPEINEDAEEVDIVTVDKDTFSDSDMSEEELCFLPAIPSPDIPKQQDKCMENPRLIYHNGSGSSTSEEAAHNGQNTCEAPCGLEDDGETSPKRKRRLSENALELQKGELETSKIDVKIFDMQNGSHNSECS